MAFELQLSPLCDVFRALTPLCDVFHALINSLVSSSNIQQPHRSHQGLGLPSSVKSCVSTTVMQTHPIPSSALLRSALKCEVLCVDHRDANTPDSFPTSACQPVGTANSMNSPASSHFNSNQKPSILHLCIKTILIKTFMHCMSI